MLGLPKGFVRGLAVGVLAAVVARTLADRRGRIVIAGRTMEMLKGTPFLGSQVSSLLAGRLMKGVYRAVAEQVVSEARSGELLELECGPGYLAVEIAQRARDLRIVAMEPSPHLVQVAEARIHSAGVGRQAKVALGAVEDIPYAENSFDFVLSLGALHRWRAPETVLSEIHRVLKPGGKAWLYDFRREMPEAGWALLRGRVSPITALLVDLELVASWRAACAEGEIGALVARCPFDKARTEVVVAEIEGMRVPALTRVTLER